MAAEAEELTALACGLGYMKLKKWALKHGLTASDWDNEQLMGKSSILLRLHQRQIIGLSEQQIESYAEVQHAALLRSGTVFLRCPVRQCCCGAQCVGAVAVDSTACVCQCSCDILAIQSVWLYITQ